MKRVHTIILGMFIGIKIVLCLMLPVHIRCWATSHRRNATYETLIADSIKLTRAKTVGFVKWFLLGKRVRNRLVNLSQKVLYIVDEWTVSSVHPVHLVG